MRCTLSERYTRIAGTLLRDKSRELMGEIRGQTNLDDIAVGVCYRLPDQEEVDDTF